MIARSEKRVRFVPSILLVERGVECPFPQGTYQDQGFCMESYPLPYGHGQR